MKQLVYMSRAVVRLDSLGFHRLLWQSMRDNLQADITGLLIHLDGHFLQVLEGEEENLDQLMEKIMRDPRHSDVRLIDYHTITERDFPLWSMQNCPVDRRRPLKQAVENLLGEPDDEAAARLLKRPLMPYLRAFYTGRSLAGGASEF